MLAVGMILHGYCNGYFGRDSYNDKRVEAFGTDWIVAREADTAIAVPEFSRFESQSRMLELVEEWAATPPPRDGT